MLKTKEVLDYGRRREKLIYDVLSAQRLVENCSVSDFFIDLHAPLFTSTSCPILC